MAGVTARAEFVPNEAGSYNTVEGTTGSTGLHRPDRDPGDLGEGRNRRKGRLCDAVGCPENPAEGTDDRAERHDPLRASSMPKRDASPPSSPTKARRNFGGKEVKSDTFVAYNNGTKRKPEYETGSNNFSYKTTNPEASEEFYRALTGTYAPISYTAAGSKYSVGRLFPMNGWIVYAGDCPANNVTKADEVWRHRRQKRLDDHRQRAALLHQTEHLHRQRRRRQTGRTDQRKHQRRRQDHEQKLRRRGRTAERLLGDLYARTERNAAGRPARKPLPAVRQLHDVCGRFQTRKDLHGQLHEQHRLGLDAWRSTSARRRPPRKPSKSPRKRKPNPRAKKQKPKPPTRKKRAKKQKPKPLLRKKRAKKQKPKPRPRKPNAKKKKQKWSRPGKRAKPKKPKNERNG